MQQKLCRKTTITQRKITVSGLCPRISILQDPTKSEQASLLQDYKARFKKQIKRPDPLAPIDRTTHRRKQYRTLNTFIRAMIYHQLKAEKEAENIPQTDKNQ